MNSEQKQKGKMGFVPSPEQIKRGCEEIRSEWTKTETIKRRMRMPDESVAASVPPQDD